MEPLVMLINQEFDGKVEAMSLYRSQFMEFFADRADCVATLTGYGISIRPGAQRVERYWMSSARS